MTFLQASPIGVKTMSVFPPSLTLITVTLNHWEDPLFCCTGTHMENLVDSLEHFSKIFSTVQPSEGLQKGKRLPSSSVTLLYCLVSLHCSERGWKVLNRRIGRGEKNTLFSPTQQFLMPFLHQLFTKTSDLHQHFYKNFWFNIYDTLFIGYLFFCLLSQEWKSHDGRTLLISRTVSSTQWTPNKYMLKEGGKCHIRTISFLSTGEPHQTISNLPRFPNHLTRTSSATMLHSGLLVNPLGMMPQEVTSRSYLLLVALDQWQSS